MIKTYSELMSLNSFKERYDYLKIGGIVGDQTFGSHRYLNQILYRSKDWKEFRNRIIIRDHGCDLAIFDREIYDTIIVHHIEPVTIEMIINRDPLVFDPNNVITTSHNTHEAIHYGNEDLLFFDIVERTANDTIPWR